MGSKVWLVFVVVIIFSLFIFVMNSGRFLKKPLSGNDDVLSYISSCQESTQAGNWPGAVVAGEKIQEAWEKVKPRLYLSSEKDDLLEFERNLTTLLASLESKDKAGATRDLALLKKLFKSLE